MGKSRLMVSALLIALLAGGFVFVYRSLDYQRAQIRARYAQMRAAVETGNTNAVLSLIAPQYRSTFDSLRFQRLGWFADPLGPRSSILIIGRDATVWPARTAHFGILPGGNTVEMVKVAGDWYFTGKVHLD
jgi:hypothetical protein